MKRNRSKLGKGQRPFNSVNENRDINKIVPMVQITTANGYSIYFRKCINRTNNFLVNYDARSFLKELICFSAFDTQKY